MSPVAQKSFPGRRLPGFGGKKAGTGPGTGKLKKGRDRAGNREEPGSRSDTSGETNNIIISINHSKIAVTDCLVALNNTDVRTR